MGVWCIISLVYLRSRESCHILFNVRSVHIDITSDLFQTTGSYYVPVSRQAYLMALRLKSFNFVTFHFSYDITVNDYFYLIKVVS